MGFAPLPMDPRGKCFCQRGCPNFEQPTSRYWLVIQTGGDFPPLDAGILMEFNPAQSNPQLCTWIPFPALPPNQLVFLTKTPAPTIPVIGYFLRVIAFIIPFAGYDTSLRKFFLPCGFDVLEIPKSQGPPGWGDAKIFRIEWWQNANDVPH